MSETPLRERAAWQALEKHHQGIRDAHIRDLFATDPGRGERLTLDAAGLYLDYSKNRITDETIGLLLRLADESGLRERIDAMFRGDRINITEGRVCKVDHSISPRVLLRNCGQFPEPLLSVLLIAHRRVYHYQTPDERRVPRIRGQCRCGECDPDCLIVIACQIVGGAEAVACHPVIWINLKHLLQFLLCFSFPS